MSLELDLADRLRRDAETDRDALLLFLERCFAVGRPSLLRFEIHQAFEGARRDYTRADLSGSALAELAEKAQEAALKAPWAYFWIRRAAGRWTYIRVHLDHLQPEAIDTREFLRFKERLVPHGDGEDPLEIDFLPFSREFPRLSEAGSIGQGVQFLNRQLSSQMFNGGAEGLERLHEFLGLHAIDGQTLLLLSRFRDVEGLRAALRRGLLFLRRVDRDTRWADLAEPLAGMGFAPGWGDVAARVGETMSLLVDLLEAPSPAALEAFLARIPMISRLLVLSPHGYFAQDNVLGLPDTGGQVVYILDQVRALEREMRDRLERQGVAVEPRILVATRLIPEAAGTTCGQRLEKVDGCRSTWILRVPFRESDGSIVPRWISRFAVWPYLERFARELEREAPGELGGRPDLIIGNYTDGNLVASLLSQRLGVTQCAIAHALEKTKYLLSALYWRENEEKYHFSCHYTADLLAMNSADFIITSTYQEIAGTDAAVGQYESYESFSMPGLYRVLHGVDVYDPRFNIISPGADPETYFSFREEARRLSSLRPKIDALLLGEEAPDACGSLARPEKPLVFTMARLDRIKNLAGFVSWYAECPRLRERANLLVIGGQVDPERCGDAEEAEQSARLHELIDRHALQGEVRWLGRRLEKKLAGELYRHVADRRGVFVQPALFEAFGLTIIEAMTSGLPVFATCHGGPAEIIEDGVSGFHIDPNDGRAAALRLAGFLERCEADPAVWEKVSLAALARVESAYTWRLYAERVMTLSRVYGFWKFVTKLGRQETARYLQMLYHLQLKPLAAGHLPS